MIITPEKKILHPVGIDGRFRLQVYRPDGRCRVDTGFFPNLITNFGLDEYGTNNSYLNQCHVGSGNAAPNFTDTGLQALVASTSTIQSQANFAEPTPPYMTTHTRTYRFAQGAAAGNLQEVGVSGIGQSLFSRALILDGQGSPTSITVLSDEFLDVTYQSRVHPPAEDAVFSINITGSGVHQVTIRPANVTTANIQNGWGMPGRATDGENAGFDFSLSTGPATDVTSRAPENASASGLTTEPYVNGSRQRRFIYEWGLNNGNSTWPAFTVDYVGSVWQGEFSPSIVKTSDKILTLSFVLAWDRV